MAERVLVPAARHLAEHPGAGLLAGGSCWRSSRIFPHNNVGLELACVLMIFTGQAWNMTFSFYHSRAVGADGSREVATVYRFSWWQRFKLGRAALSPPSGWSGTA